MSIIFSDNTQWNQMSLTGKIFITATANNPKFNAIIEELKTIHKRVFSKPMDEQLKYHMAMIMYIENQPVAGMFLEEHTPLELTELTTHHVMALLEYKNVIAPMYDMLQKWAQNEMEFFKIFSITSFAPNDHETLTEKGFELVNDGLAFVWMNNNAEWKKAVDYANEKLMEKRTADAEKMMLQDFCFDADEDLRLFLGFVSDFSAEKRKKL